MDTMNRNFRSLADAPRELALVYVLKFIESYAYFSMSMILTLYLSDEFGMTDLQAGAVYGVYGALTTAYGFGVGFLVDNMGVKVSLVLGFVSLLLARFLFAITTSMWVLKLCLYVLMPFGSALGIPVMSMGIKRYTNERNRGFAFGLFYAMMNVAALMSGFLVDTFEIAVKGGADIFGYHFSSKRLIILSGTVTTFVGLIIALFFREIKVDARATSSEVASTEIQRASPWTIIKELCVLPQFWKFMAVTLICVNLKCIFRYMDALMPKYLVREFGENVPKGTINSINPAIIIILVPIVSAFTSKVRAYRMIHFGSYITALSVLPMCFATEIGAVVSFVVALSVGEAFWSPRFYDLTVSMAPEGREGTFVAMGSAPIFLAKLPVGVLSGYLVQKYCPQEGVKNSQMMWWIIFLITAPAPILLTLCKNCLGRRMEEDAKNTEMKAVGSSSSDSEEGSTDIENMDSSEDSS